MVATDLTVDKRTVLTLFACVQLSAVAGVDGCCGGGGSGFDSN